MMLELESGASLDARYTMPSDPGQLTIAELLFAIDRPGPIPETRVEVDVSDSCG